MGLGLTPSELIGFGTNFAYFDALALAVISTLIHKKIFYYLCVLLT